MDLEAYQRQLEAIEASARETDRRIEHDLRELKEYVRRLRELAGLRS